jgi:hypothetical protein|tara:strand:- start:110 stop:553 length:444 start_codon:yes stop_codon:yes gene_type:complete
MKWIFSSVLFFFLIFMYAQQPVSKKDSINITTKLFKQQSDWNAGDIDAFMEGYLKTEHLIFSGASGPIYGWEATRDRYKKNYSSSQLMGMLAFKILDMISLSALVVQLQGSFYLTRDIEDTSDFFTLTWLKVKDQWFIISDHTSATN